ncbi:Transposase IS200 like protein [Symmachiella dynata]|uniref:Transposase IS200 like protein n=1 Tax=Symmachiella dynata TaxID=2527995 RepID=A0A517ZNW7_9PLAN|nr:transposase [Symmachiella dynata]QDU44110.1 Transposase IS200 like protein [Symmachiella dynata]
MSDKRRQFDDKLYCHFVTFSCQGRRRLLDEDQPKRILLGQLNTQLEHRFAKCLGFVVMPNHVHVLIQFSETGQLSRFMQHWKRRSSHAIRKWYREGNSAYFQFGDLPDCFWTPKYYSIEIYSDRKLSEKLDYMHLNPVRAGLVERCVDWQWSSARWYFERKSVGVPIDGPN